MIFCVGMLHELHMRKKFISFLFTQCGGVKEQKTWNFHETKKAEVFFICLNTVLYLSFANSCSDPEKAFS